MNLRSLARAAALATLAALAAGPPGCAGQRPAVSKIVGGRVIITRSIDPNAYEHVARALLYEEQERYSEAVLELKRALNFDRDAPEVHARIAEVYLKLDKVDDAAAAVRDSLKLGDTVDGLIADAHVRTRRGDQAGAVAALRRAAAVAPLPATAPGQPPVAEAAPEVIDAHLELADAQLVALDVDGARTTLRTLADAVPGGTVARIRLAAVAWALGAGAEAERRLREALRVEPNHIEGLLMLAWLYTAEGRQDDARARFAEALERSEGALDVATAYVRFLMTVGKAREAADLAEDLGQPAGGDDDSLFARIELERAAHRPERALTLARTRRASEQATEELRARLDLVTGDILAEDKPSEALAVLARVPRTAPSFTESRVRGAELLREQGKLDEAGRWLVEAAAAAPGEAAAEEIAIAQALLEEKKGAFAAALAHLDRALAGRPGSRRLRLQRAMSLERAGRWQDALAAADALIAQEPASAEALNFWGFVAADRNHDLARARQRIRAALSFDPGSGAILDSLGWAHLRLGELGPAAQFLEQAARLEPEDPEILGHLAELYQRRGQGELARERLRKALAGKPDPELRRRLEQQLDRLAPGTQSGVGAPPSAS